MKTSYGIILVLAVATTVLLTAALPCWAVEKEEENIWLEDEPKRGHRQLELTEEKIERIMSRLAETNPEKAKELAQLREKDPEKFKAELRKVMHKRLGKRVGEHTGWQDKPWVGLRLGRRGEPHKGRRKETFRERLWQKHAEYIKWMEENYPEEAEKLAELREKKPELYIRRCWLSKKRYGRIAEAAKENPKLAKILKEDLELKKKRDKLLRKIGAASDDEKKELIGQLEEVVGNRFDLILKRKQMAYERLRKKLERVKERVKRSEAEVEKWKEVRSEEVKERLEELISRSERFDWE